MMRHEKYRKDRLIVAFGDITGFSSFWDSITNDEKELGPFMDDFVSLIETVQKETGYNITIPGDGFMLTVALDQGHNCHRAVQVFQRLWDLLIKMQELVRKKEFPRPDGFRVRVACGWVMSRVLKDKETLYWGKHINLAHNLLDVRKDIPFLCHESVKQLLSESQIKHNNFRFWKVDTPEILPDGVTPHDGQSLFAFEFRGKHSN